MKIVTLKWANTMKLNRYLAVLTHDKIPWLDAATGLKDHRQRIPRFVIRRYLERSIQKKLFLQFTVITNNDYFSKKNSICENLLSRYM